MPRASDVRWSSELPAAQRGTSPPCAPAAAVAGDPLSAAAQLRAAAAFVHVTHTTLPVGEAGALAARCGLRRTRPRSAAARRCVVVAGVGSAPSGGGVEGDFLGEWMPASASRWALDEDEAGGDGEQDVAKPVMAMVGGGVGVEFDFDDEFGDDDDLDDVDDDEDDEEEEKDDDDDEDDDLASYEIETVDEDDVVVPARAERTGRGVSSMGLGGADLDEEDDVEDFEEGHGDLVDVSSSPNALVGDDEVSSVGLDPRELGDDDLADLDGVAPDNLFDEESEAELRSAAETLKGSGLLGLGVEGASRSDSSELVSFLSEDGGGDSGKVATPRPAARRLSSGPTPSPALANLPELVRNSEVTPPLPEDDVFDDGLLDISNDEFDDPPADEDPLLAGPKNLDAYTDDDEHDDELMDFGVTTATSFGRIWELNDDAYVTITEPGEAYAYDIEERDQEDQDSAVLRRGKAGGWGGSLASDAHHELPTGSKEWIARRAYDLVKNASASEMYKWTRARKSPPEEISALFPPEPKAAPAFGVTTLENSGLSLDGEDDEDWCEDEMAEDDSAELDAVSVSAMRRRADGGAAAGGGNEGETSGLDAIERSVDFPCLYKFKVVGSGDRFVETLTSEMEAVLGCKVPQSAFEFEPAGRYQRVTINVEVDSARQVTDLYDAVRMAPGVKFSYG
jgi:putative lipoic acid-binding regulatory protein